MIHQFNLYIDLNAWRLDREEDRDLPQPHSIFFFPLAAKTNWTLRPFPFSSFFPATAAFRFKGTRQPSTPAHQYNGALHSFKGLSPIFDLLTPLCFEDLTDLTLADEYVFSKVVDIASRERSYTLSVAVSSPIFQSLWVGKASVTPVQISTLRNI